VSAILNACQGVPAKTVEPGAVLFTEGTQDGMLYVLIKGEVEILKGDFQVNIVTEPGAVFGEMSLLLNSPHMATVRARKASQVCVIQDGDGFLRSNAAISYDLLKLIAGRLHGVTNHLTNLNQFIHAM
jgi:CRP-like cAMP-binding protein